MGQKRVDLSMLNPKQPIALENVFKFRTLRGTTENLLAERIAITNIDLDAMFSADNIVKKIRTTEEKREADEKRSEMPENVQRIYERSALRRELIREQIEEALRESRAVPTQALVLDGEKSATLYDVGERGWMDNYRLEGTDFYIERLNGAELLKDSGALGLATDDVAYYARLCDKDTPQLVNLGTLYSLNETLKRVNEQKTEEQQMTVREKLSRVKSDAWFRERAVEVLCDHPTFDQMVQMGMETR